jgi:hypothetical protein
MEPPGILGYKWGSLIVSTANGERFATRPCRCKQTGSDACRISLEHTGKLPETNRAHFTNTYLLRTKCSQCGMHTRTNMM